MSFETEECNGICLYAADIGVPEAGDVVAYSHPDCPAHGDPVEEDPDAEVCGAGEETLRYVRESDVDSGCCHPARASCPWSGVKVGNCCYPLSDVCPEHC